MTVSLVRGVLSLTDKLAKETAFYSAVLTTLVRFTVNSSHGELVTCDEFSV